jgi:hypothetical protein
MRTGTVVRVALGVALGAGVLTWSFVTPRKGQPMPSAADARVDAEASMDEALAESFPASDPPASTTPLTIGQPRRTTPRKQDEAVREPAEASA